MYEYITDQEIIDILEISEDYYIQLSQNNLNRSYFGLPHKSIQKINSLFYLNLALEYRIEKSIFDLTSKKLYIKIKKLLPLN